MYITKLSIKNIRSIRQLDFELSPEECAGWHVLLGDNGSGKSTVLRSIALALIGKENAGALRQNWDEWLAKNKHKGSIAMNVISTSVSGMLLNIDLAMIRDTEKSKVVHLGELSEGNLSEEIILANALRTIEFSAGFGPFRRFTGGTSEYQRSAFSDRTVLAHLSIFGEDIALTDALEWLRELHFQRLEKRPEGKLLEQVQTYINQDGFLPHGAKLTDISSEGVTFTDANGSIVPVGNLSDGFRSILSMTFEIIRQLRLAFPDENIFSEDDTQITSSGIILIDEVDAHLHPTWQRQIGFWFRDHFPNMQFIVTTHSPLVCQAADKGSVWKLPTPGTDEQCERVSGQELNRVLYGNILEAYSTTLFGVTSTRSDEAKGKMERLASLNLKEVFNGLDDDERTEQSSLRSILPTVANATPNSMS